MTDIISRRFKETDTQFTMRQFNHCMWQVSRYYELQAERRKMGWREPAIFYQTQSAAWYERAVECRARYDQALAELIPGTQVRWDEIFFISNYLGVIGIGQNSVFYFGQDVPTDYSGEAQSTRLEFDKRLSGGQTAGELLGVMGTTAVHSPDLEWQDVFALVPTQRKVQRSQKIVIEPKPHKPVNWTNGSIFIGGDGINEQAVLNRAALKLQLSSPYGKWKTMSDPRPREDHYKPPFTSIDEARHIASRLFEGQTPREKYDNSRDVPMTLEQISDQLKRWLS